MEDQEKEESVKEEPKKEEAKKKEPKKLSFLYRLHTFFYKILFAFACTLFNVYTIKTIWNWHAPDLLGLAPVSFAGVFLIIFLLKRIVVGRMWDAVEQSKYVTYVIAGLYEDNSMRENQAFLVQNCIALVAAWLLKNYERFL